MSFAKLSAALTPSVSLATLLQVKCMLKMDEAFRILRESLCMCVVLHVTCVFNCFILYKYASRCSPSAYFHVLKDKEEPPVSFISKKLRGAEKTYSLTKLEMLAIVAAVIHFELFYIYGSSLVV